MSLTSPSLTEQAKAAIQALTSAGGAKDQADAWLVDFQRSTAAWEVADKLLRDETETSYRFFGAKFLYAKVQRQFLQLDETSSGMRCKMD